MMKKPVQGKVELELTYTPLELVAEQPPAASSATSDAAAAEGSVLSSNAAPKGGSEGIDWSTLSTPAAGQSLQGSDFELCCFITHSESSTEAAIWRSREQRRVVLAFRGTSDPRDMVTDVQLLQVPYEAREDGRKSDDPRQVHKGFFEGASAVSRRLKELLIAACAGTAGEWEVLVTGHSLGGALATLVAPDLASGIDTSRGFKARDDRSWFASMMRGVKKVYASEPPRLGRLRLYTFGAPRVGNSAFAEHFDSFGMEAFRIVNGQDIVPRMPRHANSAGALLDYEHCGRTVLVDETGGVEGGFWVEGEDEQADCPLRDVSPFTNPFGSKTILGELSATAAEAAAAAWGDVTKSGAESEGEQEFDFKGLARSFGGAAAKLSKASEGIASRVQSMKAVEALGVIGLDVEFVESEMKLAESIRSGTGLVHHLEPSYFEAMRRGLDASSKKG